MQKNVSIVKGNCKFEIDTVKDLDGYEKMRVASVNRNTFGGNPHIKAVGA